MPVPLPRATRVLVDLFLEYNLPPAWIARHVGISLASVYNIRRDVLEYGTATPQRLPSLGGRPLSASPEVMTSLEQYVLRNPCVYQDEIAGYLWQEFGLEVHRTTVSRMLRRMRFSRKVARRVSYHQSMLLRSQWIAETQHLLPEQCIFVDESAFNERTGWRRHAYSRIGHSGRYHGDVTRGRCWSVLPAYTVDGYLPCTLIQEGSINGEEFYNWIATELLPHCAPYPAPKSVVIMDNCGTHRDYSIEEAIEEAGCRIMYLPPYSPDLNPIELTFGVLKAWIRRHFVEDWPLFSSDFGAWLRYAVAESHCDRFGTEHFKHCDYISSMDFNALMAVRLGDVSAEEVAE